MGVKKQDSSDLVQRRRDVFNYYLKTCGLKNIKEVAAKCGYAQQTLYNKLNGDGFNMDAARKLSEALLCTPEELMEGTLRDSVKEQIENEKIRQDYDIVLDERLWTRMMILSQQRTIENLSFIAKEKLQKLEK